MEYGTNIVEVTRVFPFQNWQTSRIVLRLNLKIAAESVELLNIAGIQYHGRVLGSQWTRLLRDGNKYLQVIEEKELNFYLDLPIDIIISWFTLSYIDCLRQIQRNSSRSPTSVTFSIWHRCPPKWTIRLLEIPPIYQMQVKKPLRQAIRFVRQFQMIYLETCFTTCAC